MNSTKIESPGNHENFFIFGSPPLDSTHNCREALKNSCHEQHRNLSRIVETGTHYQQNAAKSIKDNTNYWETTAVNVDSYDEIHDRSISSKPTSHLPENGFSKRKDVNKPSKHLHQHFKTMSIETEKDDYERETLNLIHTNLTRAECYNVTCLFCERISPVFDDFPVVDGTLFTSPVKLSPRGVPIRKVTKEANEKFMEFICVGCLTGKSSSIRCVACDKYWSGNCFQLGKLYSYNILSSMPCCSRHVDCKKCCKPIIDANSDAYFSFYSNKITCPHCQVEDFHFIKSPVLFGK